ncbi:MAG: DegT/DnrJ/EryC1/StrS family aminotransferase, partial [Candidatus Korobacteraceae bacterium]
MPLKTAATSAVSPSAAHNSPVPMLDLKRQYESIKDEIAQAIERVLVTQHFIGGPEVQGFERESAEYLGARASVGCASGTDALWLALRACGVEENTSVITTPF